MMEKSEIDKQNIKIGILGNGFMGRMRSHAYTTVAQMFPDLTLKPELHAVSGLDENKLKQFAANFGFGYYTTDWMEIIEDEEIEIINICLPEYLHAEPAIKALNAGKHVFCEKALALTSEEAKRMVEASQANDKVDMCGLNYRFFPAIQLARKLIKSGKLGEIYTVRASYYQESGHDPDRPAEEVSYAYGSHPLGSSKGLGSHVVDMCRFLVGELQIKNAVFKTFIDSRITAQGKKYPIKTDDFSTMTVVFDNGAIGILSTSKVATGRKNWFNIEINGSKGSLEFDLDKLNFLKIYESGDNSSDLMGYKNINVTEKKHPFMEYWWPPSHNLGWEHSHINETYHFLKSISKNEQVSPMGATFKDGYEAVKVIEEARRISGK